MTLPSFLTTHEPNDIFVQPQLTRYHHPFRSPMNSEKINLEMGQLRFDIFKLYEKFNALVTAMKSDFDIIENGSGADIYSVSWISAATPTPTNTLITSLQIISQSLERMSQRLLILEKGL